MTREHCLTRDQADPLAPLRDLFVLPEGKIYLVGNSLGALPRATAAHMRDVVEHQWGQTLIGGWNTHDWIGAPERLGASIAPLIGADPAEILVADTTSINLFKLAAAALALRPGRRVIVSEAGNFPTDLYILQGLRDLLGDVELRIVQRAEIPAALDADVALLLLSHVHYKSGRRWAMAGLTAQAHAAGALTLWDLSHSTGAVQLALNACHADFAVGCGYKFLNGGPGAPSFLFVAARHQPNLQSPLTGWLGHTSPFVFRDDYEAAPGIRRMLCSSPSILAISALDSALALWNGIDMAAVEAKAGALGDLLISLVEETCRPYGVELASPRPAAERGAQVSFTHAQGYAVMQALIERGIMGDFRAPDIIRFGLAPLYLRYVDIWDAAAALHDVLATGAWRDSRFQSVATVT